jgi:uncharacterized protein YjaG (DUF416 family)
VKAISPPDDPFASYVSTLKARLAALPAWQQAAFGASCAERLHPAYAAFRAASGMYDGRIVRRALDLAWEGAATGRVSEGDPSAVVE